MEKKKVVAAVSMVTMLAWAIFIILFALVWAEDLSLFQNVVILIASLVAAVAVGAGTYGMVYGWEPSRTK
ncbi:MAG: hypothetical protein V3W22_04120 [Thermoplasmata archaeon]